MSVDSFSKALKNIQEMAKSFESVAAQIQKDMSSRMESLPKEDKEKIYKIVKESSDVINNKDMDLGQKLSLINELKTKYGNSEADK